MIDAPGLLYIQPMQLNKPIVDELTLKMCAALKKSTTGAFSGGSFEPDAGWRGFHTCSCGAKSTAVDYLLENGYATNWLAAHYLACHRSEVTADQLDKVKSLPDPDDSLTSEDIAKMVAAPE